MTDFYSQNRCVCSTRSHGPLLCAFCLSFHFKLLITCGVIDSLKHVLTVQCDVRVSCMIVSFYLD